MSNESKENGKSTAAAESNDIRSTFKASPVHPGSTTPETMKVLVAPEGKSNLSATTFSPFIPSGFLPVVPTSDSVQLIKTKSIMYGEKVRAKKNDPLLNEKMSIPAARKPRRPQKEDEYSIPSLTTSSTSSPEVNKGYQTITEATTAGPKVIWYNHNQTPEDTFYPNTDPFLVPPEESSIEILSDLLSVQPRPDNSLTDIQSSFSPTSSEITYKYNDKSKAKGRNRNRNSLSFNSNEKVEDVNGSPSSWGPRLPAAGTTVKENKLNSKIASLQQAASSDHDGIRDYFEDVDGKNGGSSGLDAYSNHDRKRYGAASYNNGYDIKHREIVPPRHKKTNRKPPYRVDDTESLTPFNDDDHYQSSYPLPPGANRHEIRPHRLRSYQHDSPPDEDDRFRGYEGDSSGRYKDELPTTDAYYPREPKYRLKENSPGFGYHGQGFGNQGPGPGFNGFGGQRPGPGFNGFGGQRPGPGSGSNNGFVNGPYGGYSNGGFGYGSKGSKDFLDMAKDYFKNSDFSTTEKWFDATIGILAFIAFGGYIIMLLYQVFSVSAGTSIGTLLGRGMNGAGEIFDLFFSKGPMGEAYLDELETIVKRAMANVKLIWKTKSFAGEKMEPQVKGEVNINK